MSFPRVLLITETSRIGGGEVNLLSLAAGFKLHGFKSTVALPTRGHLTDRLERARIPFYIIPGAPSRSLSTYVKGVKLLDPLALAVSLIAGIRWLTRLRAHMRSAQPDLVHTASIWAHICGGLAAKLEGIATAAHFQDIVHPSSGFGLFRVFLNLWARTIPDRIVCISPLVAAQFRHDSRTARKTLVVWNGVNIRRFTPGVPFPDGRPDGAPLKIGTAARMTRWKGQRVALQVSRQLKERGVPFQWQFVGDAALGDQGYYWELLDDVRRFGLEGCVRFMGWVDEMADFYRSLDLLVHLPLEPEPFGLVIAEAMASGLPVITTAGGGLERVVGEGGGWVVSPGEAEPVTEIIECLWRSPEEQGRRSLAARAQAEKVFYQDDYLGAWSQLYHTLLEEKP